MVNGRWMRGATRKSQVFHTLMPTLPVKRSVCPQLYNALKWNPVLIDVSLVKCSNFRISFLWCQWARGHATAAHDCTANRWIMCVCVRVSIGVWANGPNFPSHVLCCSRTSTWTNLVKLTRIVLGQLHSILDRFAFAAFPGQRPKHFLTFLLFFSILFFQLSYFMALISAALHWRCLISCSRQLL